MAIAEICGGSSNCPVHCQIYVNYNFRPCDWHHCFRNSVKNKNDGIKVWQEASLLNGMDGLECSLAAVDSTSSTGTGEWSSPAGGNSLSRCPQVPPRRAMSPYLSASLSLPNSKPCAQFSDATIKMRPLTSSPAADNMHGNATECSVCIPSNEPAGTSPPLESWTAVCRQFPRRGSPPGVAAADGAAHSRS